MSEFSTPHAVHRTLARSTSTCAGYAAGSVDSSRSCLASDDGRARRLRALVLVQRIVLLRVLLADARVQRIGVALGGQHAAPDVSLVGPLLVLGGHQVRHPEGGPRYGEEQPHEHH